MNDVKELLAVLDLPEDSDKQRAWIGYFMQLPPSGPCRHKGCLSHRTHPREVCGRIGGYPIYIESLADLAFRLRGGERFIEALYIVWRYTAGEEKPELKRNELETKDLAALLIWYVKQGAIINVIAALIAKALAKGD